MDLRSFVRSQKDEGYSKVVVGEIEKNIDEFLNELNDEDGKKMVTWGYNVDYSIEVFDFQNPYSGPLITLHLPDDFQLYVNAYRVTRHYGGPEEGGWWWDRRECVETMIATPRTADKIRADMEKKWKKEDWGNIYSVLDGAEHQVSVERKPAETEQLGKPDWS